MMSRMNITAEAKIAALGLELPSPAVPKGNFVNFLVVGNLAYLSGHLPQVGFHLPMFDSIVHMFDSLFSILACCWSVSGW